MALVIDANVVFSCIISRGKALDIVFELYDRGILLVSPKYISGEIKDNLSKISKYSGLSEEEVLAFISNLFSEFIRVTPESEYRRFLPEAMKISPHSKDSPYFALSLAFNKAPIWSREPRLKRQKVIRILSDSEVKEYFGLTDA